MSVGSSEKGARKQDFPFPAWLLRRASARGISGAWRKDEPTAGHLAEPFIGWQRR